MKRPVLNAHPNDGPRTPLLFHAPYLAPADAAAYLGVGVTHFNNVIRPQLPWHDMSNPDSDRQINRWKVADLDAFAATRRRVA